jgi:hypothetical protein
VDHHQAASLWHGRLDGPAFYQKLESDQLPPFATGSNRPIAVSRDFVFAAFLKRSIAAGEIA